MPRNNYGLASRVLHYLALGSNALAETSFDIEQAFYGKQILNVSHSRHVFVSGLARAGSTLLMRMLYETGEFASLTYRDAPFFLAPNLWSKAMGLSSKNKKAEERAHGDGVYVDFDSPEALEEIFWRVFVGKDYIRKKGLFPVEIDNETLAKFRSYISTILYRYQGSRYLSKNNNNVLRLGSIHKAFPNAIVLVPFRDPIQHVNSLLKQHHKFQKEHASDAFTRQYMQWLVHHEFGSDHRPFVFSPDQNTQNTADMPEYWLEQWTRTYSHIDGHYQNRKNQPIYVCYELLCERPKDVWEGLKRQCFLPQQEELNVSIRKPSQTQIEIKDQSLLDKAREIYQKLRNTSQSQFLSPREPD